MNAGTSVATEVWIKVDFKTKTDQIAFSQEFKVIPGGSGKTIFGANPAGGRRDPGRVEYQ